MRASEYQGSLPWALESRPDLSTDTQISVVPCFSAFWHPLPLRSTGQACILRGVPRCTRSRFRQRHRNNIQMGVPVPHCY